MAKIGIFWFYKKQVLGKTCDFSKGQENVPGIIDSPYAHVDLWDSNLRYTIPFRELQDVEYYEIPRGRVVYVKTKNKVIVYLDRVILSKEGKRAVSDFFQLSDVSTEWVTDEHYTTDPKQLNKLFLSDDY